MTFIKIILYTKYITLKLPSVYYTHVHNEITTSWIYDNHNRKYILKIWHSNSNYMTLIKNIFWTSDTHKNVLNCLTYKKKKIPLTYATHKKIMSWMHTIEKINILLISVNSVDIQILINDILPSFTSWNYDNSSNRIKNVTLRLTATSVHNMYYNNHLICDYNLTTAMYFRFTSVLIVVNLHENVSIFARRTTDLYIYKKKKRNKPQPHMFRWLPQPSRH